jgi:hypothetical protein
MRKLPESPFEETDMRTRIAIVSLLFAALPCLAATPEEMEALLAQGVSGEALDRVCGVRDCADIRLFWHTDLEAAKKQALAEGKPILSLRLLGRLDEEFSCANSRYFRTVYYKNREINDLLRERFVLHWRSLRPVPKVTIDFGDGNRLERTITGNSIHYVLDSRGRLIDALPGLSGPEAFLALLQTSQQAAQEAAGLDDANLARWASRRNVQELNDRARKFLKETGEVVIDPEPVPAEAAEPAAALAPASPTETELARIPTARDAWANLESLPGVVANRKYVGGLETASKAAGERPILEAFDIVTDEMLVDLAELRRPRIHLDEESRAFLLRKHGITDPAEARRLVDGFETTVALDEVINEYRTRPAILKRLSEPREIRRLDLEAFNEWVYEQVFLTPLSDPWMGLAPKDVYLALPAGTRTAARP